MTSRFFHHIQKWGRYFDYFEEFYLQFLFEPVRIKEKRGKWILSLMPGFGLYNRTTLLNTFRDAMKFRKFVAF